MRGPPKIILRNSQLKGKSHLKVLKNRFLEIFVSALIPLAFRASLGLELGLGLELDNTTIYLPCLCQAHISYQPPLF